MLNADSIRILLLTQWLKKIGALAYANGYKTTFAAIGVTLSGEFIEIFMKQEYFGTTNMVLSLVFLTVFFNTYYGVRKSKVLFRYYEQRALDTEIEEKQVDLFIAKMQRNAFSAKRLQFVFFKCMSLLGYLYFVTKLLEDNGTFFDFTTEALCKAPVAIFWYYEFKSIGENSTVIYDKKASIFTIVEAIFELKILKFFEGKDIFEKKNKSYEHLKDYENESPPD